MRESACSHRVYVFSAASIQQLTPVAWLSLLSGVAWVGVQLLVRSLYTGVHYHSVHTNKFIKFDQD